MQDVLVTEASGAVCGTAAPDGFIRVRNDDRKSCLNLKLTTILLFNKHVNLTCA